MYNSHTIAQFIIHYSYSGYKLRNQLAAIDFNKHADRPVAVHGITGATR